MKGRWGDGVVNNESPVTIPYQLSITPYEKPFRQPVKTSYGEWKIRQGIIISLQDSVGNISYGEIAPLPQFGSESLEEALSFCYQFSQITETDIDQIPNRFPACQFAFESALEGFSRSPIQEEQFQLSHLLPAGKQALETWQFGWQQGQKTFKWKIGLFWQEYSWFQQLINDLPDDCQVRLDANAGLTMSQAEQWLQLADASGKVEFLEQPLPPNQFQQMQELAVKYQTPIALDESVGTLHQLETCYQQGWRGIFVIKCAITGSARYLRHLCQCYSLDVVLSSVMETEVAREAVFQLASELSTHRALGFGVNHWFDD